jgi:hypothetical protein
VVSKQLDEVVDLFKCYLVVLMVEGNNKINSKNV